MQRLRVSWRRFPLVDLVPSIQAPQSSEGSPLWRSYNLVRAAPFVACERIELSRLVTSAECSKTSCYDIRIRQKAASG